MENDARDVVALVDAARVEKRGGVTGEARIGALPMRASTIPQHSARSDP